LRRLRALLAATALALAGCFPCEGTVLVFPDHPLIVAGTWTGVATSNRYPDVGLRLRLEVAYVDERTYAATGALELDDGTVLEADGTGYGFCEQRFEPAASITVATPAPEAPRFEATLIDPTGRTVGRLLAVRVLGADDGDTMRGELHLEDGATERRFIFELVRLASTAGG
jgi:hypothetical protein